jgi:hypothetical protein
MECKKIERAINNNNYIEFITTKLYKRKNIKDIFIQIIKYTNKLSIDDFYLNTECSIPRFVIYKDKEDVYINQLHIIKKNIVELYQKDVIQYAGYQ